MLKSLDVLIGVATVMLVFSLMVTVFTQLIVETVRLRRRYLRSALLDLFNTLAWRFSGNSARLLAREIAGKGSAARDAITREDLVETLLTLAPGHAELKAALSGAAPESDFTQALSNARRAAAETAVQQPHLASSVVRGHAILSGPAAPIAMQVFSVFDAAMDRAGRPFTAASRTLVLVIATLVAVAFPLDTFDLFRRFARSDVARAEAMQVAESFAGDHAAAITVRLERLEAAEVIVAPKTFREWRTRIAQVNWAGVAASALLLSLGAPFWFHTLQDLVRLRSAVAGQEKLDRRLRDSPQPLSFNLPVPASPDRPDRQS